MKSWIVALGIDLDEGQSEVGGKRSTLLGNCKTYVFQGVKS